MPSQFVGRAVKDIPELANSAAEINSDLRSWVTDFRCNICGQIWQERYESHGHSDIPSVTKLEPSASA